MATIHARFKCEFCHQNPCPDKHKPREWQGEIEDYQLGMVAIWFHAFHEGHRFSYWENGELVVGPGD